MTMMVIQKMSVYHMLKTYNVSVTVHYVDGTNPNTNSLSRSFYKKVDVTVSSQYMTLPVVLSFIFTYEISYMSLILDIFGSVVIAGMLFMMM